MRSERLLRGMHQVCSHDLPNQLVALQSLLEMLQLDEQSQLSPDGLEYVRRLKSATQRTTKLACFLKDMEKLSSYVARQEAIALPWLARELQSTLTERLPHTHLTFNWQWGVSAIVGDSRTLMQALIEILSWSAVRQGDGCCVRGRSSSNKNQVGLNFELQPTDAAGNNLLSPPPRAVELPREKHIEIILAREYLAISQATLEWHRVDDAGDRFTVLLTNP